MSFLVLGDVRLTHHDRVPLTGVVGISALFITASVISHQSGLDLWLAKHIYSFEGGIAGNFPWKNNFWLDDVIHEAGRRLVKTMFFAVLALFLASFCSERLYVYRPTLFYLLLATLLSTSAVGSLKQLTAIPCPSAIKIFGGDGEWVDIWQIFSPELPAGRCYPAGHSSGGYAWLAIAFTVPYASRSFYWALVPGITLGATFGFAQQFRGAHFFSHDLATIAVCWLASGTAFHLLAKLAKSTQQNNRLPLPKSYAELNV